MNEVLAPALAAHNVFVDTHSITTGRKHGRTFRGGWDSYGKLQRDLLLWMKQDQNADSWFTTMIDYYRLPTDFPGYVQSRVFTDPMCRVASLEQNLTDDIRVQLSSAPVSQRFVPYIQVHEFEALLFSNVERFITAFPDQSEAIGNLRGVRASFQSPEHINEGATTAPSKRILAVIPDYSKTVSGLLIAKSIGFEAMRRECRRFDDWIRTLIA